MGGGSTLAGGGGVRRGEGGGVGSFAEKRNVESGTSNREDRSKTAQILLEKPFKNHRKK